MKSDKWFAHPLFRIHGRELSEIDERASDAAWRLPEFRLLPTPQFYAHVALGMLVASIPLVSRSLVLGAIIAVVFTTLFGWLIRQLWIFERNRLEFGNAATLIQSLPETYKKRQAIASLVTVALSTVASWILLMRNYSDRENPFGDSLGRIIPLALPLLFAILWRAFAEIWTAYSPFFRLATLESEYQQVHLAVREKITFATRRARRIFTPAIRWRHATSITQEIQLYGQASVLFSVDVAAPAWKKSLRALAWYYAAVTVPGLLLISLPPMTLVLQSLLKDSCVIQLYIPERQELAISALLWAGWSIAAFTILSERDFGDRAVANDKGVVARDVDAIRFGVDENRRVLREYLSDNGVAVLQLLVMAATPLLMGYFGLFPEPDAAHVAKEPFEAWLARCQKA